MTLTYTIRPISDRTAFAGPPSSGNRNPFDSTWRSTLELERELDHLDAHRLVLEIDVREQDLKLDGTLRANARTETSPAVRLAFESVHGPLVYATDRYGWTYGTPARPVAGGWQQNVRAVALGLEALRKVDRYGISRRGEQYRGYNAIGAGDGTVATSMTTDLAKDIIGREAGGHTSITAGGWKIIAKAARANAHPDRNNGDRSRWDAVEEAIRVLERSGWA